MRHQILRECGNVRMVLSMSAWQFGPLWRRLCTIYSRYCQATADGDVGLRESRPRLTTFSAERRVADLQATSIAHNRFFFRRPHAMTIISGVIVSPRRKSENASPTCQDQGKCPGYPISVRHFQLSLCARRQWRAT
jgi:hypothetical protein